MSVGRIHSNLDRPCPECKAPIGTVCSDLDGIEIERVHYARTINIKGSGEHAAVREMRAKFESIADHEVSALDALNERIDNLGTKVSSHPPTASEEELTPEEELAPDTLPEGPVPQEPEGGT
jgi:hypothetical protein